MPPWEAMMFEVTRWSRSTTQRRDIARSSWKVPEFSARRATARRARFRRRAGRSAVAVVALVVAVRGMPRRLQCQQAQRHLGSQAVIVMVEIEAGEAVDLPDAV